MEGGARFGAYGKIPVLGDFLRIALAPDFVQAWDAWLQAAMSDAAARLGPRFDACYMRAPIWRFTVAPGLAGARGMTGVLMPSVDRVGRRFPLTLAAPSGAAPGPADLRRDLFAPGAVLSRVEALALDALEDDMTRDGLEARLSELMMLAAGPLAGSLAGSLAGPSAGPGQGDPVLLLERGQVGEGGRGSAFLDLGAGGDADPGPRPAGGPRAATGAARLILSEALPRGDAAAALFDPDGASWAAAA